MASVTLSSVGTATIPLDPIAKQTGVAVVYPLSSNAVVYSIDGTMNDPMRETVSWFLISSSPATSSAAGSQFNTVLSPLHAVRLNITTASTSATALTFTALQSDAV